MQPELPPEPRSPGLRAPERPPRGDNLDFDYRAGSRRQFVSLGGLSLAVKVLLALNLVFSLVILGSDYLQFELANRLTAGERVPEQEILANDARQSLLAIGYLIVYLPTVVVFVIWFYRAHANLQPLGADKLKYTSGWAAGCWFVPILNLFRPVQIAQEIWRNSDPKDVAADFQVARPASSALIGFWWAMWLLCNFASSIAPRMTVDSPGTLETASTIEMVAEGLSVIAAGLAFAVVQAISARQAERWEALESSFSARDRD